MRRVSYEQTYGEVDLRVYTELMAEDNHAQIGRLKQNLTHALRQDITAKQREYMILYYAEGLTMEEIARRGGVNKSTVSRTLKRGRQRLYRCLRYGAANLLEQAGR